MGGLPRGTHWRVPLGCALSFVGAFRKHASGMFLASDRSGCATRREPQDNYSAPVGRDALIAPLTCTALTAIGSLPLLCKGRWHGASRDGGDLSVIPAWNRLQSSQSPLATARKENLPMCLNYRTPWAAMPTWRHSRLAPHPCRGRCPRRPVCGRRRLPAVDTTATGMIYYADK